ncbi:DUF4157 domain-containing protein [Streptomyces sp. UP1A-1]|nr:DUF4157 domain-containing protein [Streptomyces sp. UP1A-1]
MRAHGTRSRTSDERESTRPVVPPSAPVQRMLDLQHAAGNAAVARTVEAGRHRHGPGCGHPAPVQREAARHEHGPGCGHGAALDTAPENQRGLLEAAKATPSSPLPGAFLSQAKAFYRNDRLSEGRVHDNPTAQRATAALGAQAMTVGKDIFLGPSAVGNTRILAHEASHLDKNLRGVRETGNDNGAGVTVTDPGQDSERAAETDGAAFEAGASTAPSVVAQRAVGAHGGERDGAVQRSTGATKAVVQRALDTALIASATETLGIARAVKIVEVPPGVRADVPFGKYPDGCVVGLSAADKELTVQQVNGWHDGSTPASEVVAQAGGGGYLAQYGIILTNSVAEGGYTVAQTIQHEMGHLKQHQDGFDVNMAQRPPRPGRVPQHPGERERADGSAAYRVHERRQHHPQRRTRAGHPGGREPGQPLDRAGELRADQRRCRAAAPAGCHHGRTGQQQVRRGRGARFREEATAGEDPGARRTDVLQRPLRAAGVVTPGPLDRSAGAQGSAPVAPDGTPPGT